jgi:hypothetical protein
MSTIEVHMTQLLRTSVALRASVLALVAVVLTFTHASAQSVATQGSGQGAAPVTIVSPLPLPVTGSVVVSGTPTVAATQSGTWIVENADAPGRRPFQLTFEGAQNLSLPAVPPGFRVVVQHISMAVFGSAGSYLNVRIQGSGGATSQDPYFALPMSPGLGASNTYVLNSPLTAYLDAGEHLLLFVGTSYVGQLMKGTVSGYMVDCGVASACAPIAP